jgi:hypothetical protein
MRADFDKMPALAADYIDAIVAYRTILRQTSQMLLKQYGSNFLVAHGAKSLQPLLDAHAKQFVTHRQAAKFVATHRTDDGTETINAMRQRLLDDPALKRFAHSLRQVGESALADDLPFFLEHRIRLGRTSLPAKVESQLAVEAASAREMYA